MDMIDTLQSASEQAGGGDAEVFPYQPSLFWQVNHKVNLVQTGRNLNGLNGCDSAVKK